MQIFRPELIGRAAVLGAALLIGCGPFAVSARAGFIMTLTEQGSNVVAIGSGTLDVTDLSLLTCIQITGMNPLVGAIRAGLAGGPAAAHPCDFSDGGLSGPTSFGSGGGPDFIEASGGSGDTVGVSGAIHDLTVPRGYVAGNALSDTSTYDNQTFSSLGVTPGTYVWTWGSGAHMDSFTLVIGVPEPSGVLLLALPLGFVVMLAACHRRATRVARLA
jgi:hypothetical protein